MKTDGMKAADISTAVQTYRDAQRALDDSRRAVASAQKAFEDAQEANRDATAALYQLCADLPPMYVTLPDSDQLFVWDEDVGIIPPMAAVLDP